MLSLIIKLILALLGLFMLGEETSSVLPVAAFLTAVTLTSLNGFFAAPRFTISGSLLYFGVSVFVPEFYPFLPLFCFDLFEPKQRITIAFAVIPVMANLSHRGIAQTVLICMLSLLAMLLRYMCKRISRLSEENAQIKDSSMEQSRLLRQHNKNLMEKQDHEVHLATLKERNRIAREIHDNVGHILSRSILQAGALQMLNKDENLTPQLSGLKDTLTLAMDSIRGSVHNLRDDSVDLYAALTKITRSFGYDIKLDYDVSPSIPNDIKYCFITILKEAMTNTAKHSDATAIRVMVQEHPVLYQLLIHDNGTKKPSRQEDGMGLINMQDRVTALDGHFNASYQDGFRIFVSIPKQKEIGK